MFDALMNLAPFFPYQNKMNNMRNDKQQSKSENGDQQASGHKRNLDDLFHEDSTRETEATPEEEAEAEQQRKEALTERD